MFRLEYLSILNLNICSLFYRLCMSAPALHLGRLHSRGSRNMLPDASLCEPRAQRDGVQTKHNQDEFQLQWGDRRNNLSAHRAQV